MTSALQTRLEHSLYEAHQNKPLQPEKVIEIIDNVLLKADRKTIEDYLDRLEAEQWIAGSQKAKQDAEYMAFLEEEAMEFDSWGADDGIE